MMSFDEKDQNKTSSNDTKLDKSNIYDILKDLGKEYSKLNKHGPSAEIIIVGGASNLLNYSFRDSTMDVDALIFANSAFKDAINKVGDKYNLPNSWLNSDFKRTESYSDKLVEHSKYFKTFYNALSIRTVTGEYLVAMKLVSDRGYKNDYSDIIGIIKDEQQNGNAITFDDIDKAMIELYGNWDKASDSAKDFIENVLNSPDLEKLYKEVSQGEYNNKETLLNIVDKYEDIVNSIDFDSFLKELSVLDTSNESISSDEKETIETDNNNDIDNGNDVIENNFIEEDDYYNDIDKDI